jgi:hypothetical protein
VKMTPMRRLPVILVPVALLAAACGGDPEPAPAPKPPTAEEFVQQVWDGWTDKDRAATCRDYADNPRRTAENTFPMSSGIPTEHVAALLKRECKG